MFKPLSQNPKQTAELKLRQQLRAAGIDINSIMTAEGVSLAKCLDRLSVEQIKTLTERLEGKSSKDDLASIVKAVINEQDSVIPAKPAAAEAQPAKPESKEESDQDKIADLTQKYETRIIQLTREIKNIVTTYSLWKNTGDSKFLIRPGEYGKVDLSISKLNELAHTIADNNSYKDQSALLKRFVDTAKEYLTPTAGIKTFYNPAKRDIAVTRFLSKLTEMEKTIKFISSEGDVKHIITLESALKRIEKEISNLSQMNAPGQQPRP